MKSFILFFGLLLITSAKAIVTSPMSNQFDAIGTISNVDKVDITVKCGATHSAGDLVTLDLSADDGATIAATDAKGEAALCVMVKACTSGGIVPCRVWGKINANFTGTADAAVAGVPVYAQVYSGKVGGFTSPSGHAYPVGIALDSSSSTGDLEIFVQLL